MSYFDEQCESGTLSIENIVQKLGSNLEIQKIQLEGELFAGDFRGR